MRLDKLLTKLGIYGQKRAYISDNWREPRPEVCEVEICDRPVYTLSWCNAHYQRALKLRREGADRMQWFEAMNSPIREKKKNEGEKKRKEN